MPWQVMPSYDSYDAARDGFEWALPEAYNPAADLLRKHDSDAAALHHVRPDGDDETYTFGDLDDLSDRLARGLEGLGLAPGDRVGVVVPQRPANPIAHAAAWKRGAVTVPLTVLFGTDALAYRLSDSGARAVVADEGVLDQVLAAAAECPDLEHVVVVGEGAERAAVPATGGASTTDDEGASPGTEGAPSAVEADAAGAADVEVSSFGAVLAPSSADPYDAYDATPATRSAIMYTSGSTGPPKGVLHSHALWLGRAAAAHNYFDQGLGPDAVVWTPADWAWGAALGGTLFAAWHHGAAVVGAPGEGFDPEAAFARCATFDVTHAFLPPTALRMLMTVDDPAGRYDLSLRTVASAGESLTPEILTWADEAFDDLPVNEFYGQTELNLVVGNCSRWFEARPGSMGKPLPGYDVAVLDRETGEALPPGEVGEIAVRPHDERVFFDEYWGLPEKTAAKRRDGWFLTGDLAARDEDGYLRFKARADDVIITSGYRVGPGEVESAVLEHPAVEQVGVVGVPDDTRGEIIKAFVEPVGGVGSAAGRDLTDDDEAAALREEIRDLVRERLAEYEYPREIEFVDELPQTTTGKIRRLDLREHEGD